MIGQKTLHSFFSPSAPRKRRSCPDPPEDPGSEAVAAAESKDASASPAKKSRPEGELGAPSSPLSPEQLDRIQKNKAAALLKLASRNIPTDFGESWKRPLSAEFGKPYFLKLMGFVAEERKHHTIYPPPHQVFTWTQLCEIRDVKVVILGQDPYHGPNQAHGLSFSVQRPVPPPPSLENIYKELSTDIDGFTHPGHGDLSGWAKQGKQLAEGLMPRRRDWGDEAALTLDILKKLEATNAESEPALVSVLSSLWSWANAGGDLWGPPRVSIHDVGPNYWIVFVVINE